MRAEVEKVIKIDPSFKSIIAGDHQFDKYQAPFSASMSCKIKARPTPSAIP
jgi:hypothetical protein